MQYYKRKIQILYRNIKWSIFFFYFTLYTFGLQQHLSNPFLKCTMIRFFLFSLPRRQNYTDSNYVLFIVTNKRKHFFIFSRRLAGMIAQFILPQSPSSKLKKQLDLYHFFVAQNPRVTNFKDMSSNFCIKVWLRLYLLKIQNIIRNSIFLYYCIRVLIEIY